MECLIVKWVPLFAIFLLASTGVCAAREDLAKYQKVMIETVGEDATSFFEYVYFYDKNGVLVRTISTWNGGCCQAPLIEEHQFDGDRFQHVRSYTILLKPESFAQYLMCSDDLEITPVEPSHAAEAGYSIAEMKNEMPMEDPVLFKGCTQN